MSPGAKLDSKKIIYKLKASVNAYPNNDTKMQNV